MIFLGGGGIMVFLGGGLTPHLSKGVFLGGGLGGFGLQNAPAHSPIILKVKVATYLHYLIFKIVER